MYYIIHTVRTTHCMIRCPMKTVLFSISRLFRTMNMMTQDMRIFPVEKSIQLNINQCKVPV